MPIIVAINKCDKQDIDPVRVKNELLQHDLIPEDMGGDVQCINISAKLKWKSKTVDCIEIQSDLLELKSDHIDQYEGVVIESKLKKVRDSDNIACKIWYT